MKKQLPWPALLAAVLSMGACYDPHVAQMDPYLSQVYFRNGGEQTLTVYRTGEDTYYPVSVCKSGFDASRSATVRVLSLTEAQLNAYNIAHETRYRLIPNDFYTLVTADETATLPEPVVLDFGPDDAYKIFKVRINTTDLGTLLRQEPDVDYVFGFILYSQDQVSPDINLMLLSPDIAIPTLTVPNNLGDKVILNDDAVIQKDYTATLKLSIDENRFPFDCTLQVMDQAWLDACNDANGTAWKLAPERCYDLTLPDVHFEAGQTDALVNLHFDLRREGMDPFTDYVVPVAVVESSKPEYELTDACYFLVPLRSEPPMNKVELDAGMVTVSGSSSYDGGGPSAIVDGFVATYWHSPYGSELQAATDPVYGICVDVALPLPLRAFQLTYWIRATNNNGRPRRIVFGVSQDGQQWTQAGEVAIEAMNAAAGAKVELPSVLAPSTFRHLRIGIAQAGDGPYELRGVPTASTALAEIEIYGTEN